MIRVDLLVVGDLNWKLLQQEAKAAHIEIEGVNRVERDGFLYARFNCAVNEADRASVTLTCQGILDAHDPAELTSGQIVAAIRAGAEDQFRNIPNWSTMTMQEVMGWHQANVADILASLPADIDALTPTQFQNNAQAIVGVMQDVLNALAQENLAKAKAIVALRNLLLPVLEAGQ